MSKSKKALISLLAVTLIAFVSLLIVYLSDKGSWAKGFFAGILFTTIFGLPYFIYVYFKERKSD